MAPFTPAEKPSVPTNTLKSFPYYHPGLGKKLTRGCMSMREETPFLQVLPRYDANSWDVSPQFYTQPLLRTLCPPSPGHFVAEESKDKSAGKTGTPTRELASSLSSSSIWDEAYAGL